MNWIGKLKWIGSALVAAVAVASSAQNSYAFRRTDIRTVFFNLNGNHLPTGAGQSLVAPHVWYNLDSSGTVKPSGWNFLNPLAAGRLELDEQPFFAARFPNTPAAGFRLAKSAARYWWTEVSSLSDDDMSLIDVGLLQVTTPNLVVAPQDRERLRRFVDKGGVLWIDLSYGSLNQANGGPVPFLAQGVASPDSNLRWDFQSPLLNYPNALSESDIEAIGFGPNYGLQPLPKLNINPLNLGAEGAASIGNLVGNLIGFTGEFGSLKPIVAAGGLPTISMAKIGDGYVVVSSRGLSEAMNRVGNNLNREFFAVASQAQNGQSIASAYARSVGKFLINLVSLASQSTQAGAGSRKNYSTFIDQGSPLLQTWTGQFAAPVAAPPNRNRPPIIYKGLAFVVTDNQIQCYDTDPRHDADNDGNSDDGILDLTLGEDADRVFATNPVSTVISSAVAVEVPNAQGGVPTDQLLVTTADGRLLIYRIFDPSGRLLSSPTVTPIAFLSAPGSGGAVLPPGEYPIPPTVHEGIAYIADAVTSGSQTNGRIWQVNLRTLQTIRTNAASTNPFVFGGTASACPPVTGGLTVGYIPILDNSGGLDKVVYAPLSAQGAPNNANAGLISLWVGARGEKPSLVVNNGASIEVQTRAGTRALPVYLAPAGDPLSVKISVVRANGVALTSAELAAIFNGAITQNQGTITLGLNTGVTWPPAGVDSDGVRVDYSIDWGQAFPSNTASLERGRLLFPSPAVAARRVVDGIALSPSGTLYVTSSTQRIGPPFGPPVSSIVNDHLGSLYAIREEGRGLFRMAWRWDLYPQHTMNFQGGSQVVPPALPDNDPVQYLSFGGFSLSSFIGGSFRGTAFQGAPVVRNNEVYVTVSGSKALAPASALLCFKDDSSAREIRVGRPLGRQLGASTAIIQPDLARSSDATNPTTISSISENEYRIERDRGEAGAVIRVDNMMRTTSGAITDSISVSQPIILRSQGQPDFVLDPAQAGDRWNPLKWYTIMHGMSVRSGAFASGNTVFVSGASVLPSVLDFNFPPVQEGFVTALRTDFDPNVARRASQSWSTNPANFQPHEVVADDARPYLKQVIALDYPRAAAGWTATQQSFDTIYPSSIFVWPQTPRNIEERGRTTLDDYRIRINQCALRGGLTPSARDVSYGVVGGDGTVIAWNATNVFGFRRADTWVADEGRIALFDPSGNVLFDSKVALSTGLTEGNTAGGKLTKFARPTRVYPIPGSAEVLVTDSDQNRIIRLNPFGSISRNLGEFVIDPNFVPSGYKTGDPLTFQNPRDAVTYNSTVLQANNRFTNAQPLELWRHYLVADQANNRVVEIVDRFGLDPTTREVTGRVAEGVLLWHSPPAISGKGFAYNSLSRIQTGASNFVVVAGIGNKAPTRLDSGEPNTAADLSGDSSLLTRRSSDTGNGGVVIFDAQLPGGYRVFDQIEMPFVDHTRKWDFTTGTWSANAQADSQPGSRSLRNVQSVTATLVPGGQIAIMIADSTGVYEAVVPVVNPTQLITRWMLPQYAMNAMRRIGGSGGTPTSENPARFFPTYARRIDSDNIIVVNGYQGRNVTNTQNFNGEVLQVDGRIDGIAGLQGAAYNPVGYSPNVLNLGFNSRSIKLRFGPIEGARGLVLPVFADRR